MQKKSNAGFIPLVVLMVIAAASLVAGAVVFKKPLTQLATKIQYSTLFAPKIEAVTNLASYTTIGTARSTTILVKFRPNVSAQAIAAIQQQFGTQIHRVIPGINVHILTIPDDTHVNDKVQQFRGRSEVQYAEPNFLAKQSLVPNDPYYSSQWNLQKIDAQTAWDKTQGGYGPVAVIDTGIMNTHPDLSAEVLSGYNFVSGNTDTSDDNGHGTHVAGIVAAQTNNGQGVASIGFHTTVLPVKVLDSTGTGTYGDVASGITYATDHGAKIINMSLSGSSSSQTLQDAVTYATQRGVFVVAAAGNNGSSSPEYPAACAGVLAVSATDTNDQLASFSNYGSDIFVSAPGVNITSTYNTGAYAQMSGTSMAAPGLSGLISLALSYPSSQPQNLLKEIEQTSNKVGSSAYDQNGWNQYYGYGRIDAGKLLTLIAQTVTPSPTPSPMSTPTPAPVFIHPSPSPYPVVARSISFNVELEGMIDHVDVLHGKVTLKVQGSSQNIGANSGDLVTLIITPATVLTQNNQPSSLASLNTNQQVNVKATWQDATLTANEITVQGQSGNGNSQSSTQQTTPSAPQSNNTNTVGGNVNVPSTTLPSVVGNGSANNGRGTNSRKP